MQAPLPPLLLLLLLSSLRLPLLQPPCVCSYCVVGVSFGVDSDRNHCKRCSCMLCYRVRRSANKGSDAS